MDLFDLSRGQLVNKLIASAVLVLLAVALRTFIARVLVRHLGPSELRRRWIVGTRNAVLLLLVAALAAVWISELQSFGYAILGVAVAFVIATKEFILCINGFALRAATNAYSIGDRIEIGGHRGDVIDLNLFTTTILEVGPGKSFHLRTGRTVVIPNSKLLDSYVVNESYMKHYMLHVFSVPLGKDDDWQRAEKTLLAAAEAECAPFIEEARHQMQWLEKEHGLQGLPVQPRVSIQIPEAGKLNLLVRIPAPVGRQGRLEQAILRRFLTEFKSREADPPSEGAGDVPADSASSPAPSSQRAD